MRIRRKIESAQEDLRERGLSYIVREKVIGRVVQSWQRSKYNYTPRQFWVDLDSIPITQPIFLLGVQGAGLTLIARTLYRNSLAVYATGNAKFWAGEDEIHNLRHIQDLPEDLVYRAVGFRNVDGKLSFHPRFRYERNWVYATDGLLPDYRRTEEDASEDIAMMFKKVIRKIIRAYARDPYTCRFVDMSQTYTVKAAFVNKLLENCHPKFVLVTRNPYAMVIRVSKYLFQRGQFFAPAKLGRTECLTLAAQHWSNSYRCALEDSEKVDMKYIRFEDFLRSPKGTLKKICSFIGFDYNPEMLPRPYHKFHLGATETNKWYPIREDVNRRYLEQLDAKAMGIVERCCRNLIDLFGYSATGCSQ